MHSAAVDRARRVHDRELKKLRQTLENEADVARQGYESQLKKLERSVMGRIGDFELDHFEYIRMRHAWILAEFHVKQLRDALEARGEEVNIQELEHDAQYPADYPSPISPYIKRPGH